MYHNNPSYNYCYVRAFEDIIYSVNVSFQPPETTFLTSSGGRGMMMSSTAAKKAGTAQSTGASNATLSLNDALNVLIQGYIKGKKNLICDGSI